MGNLFGGRKRGRSSGTSTKRSKPEYADDGVRPMPSFDDPLSQESARIKRLNLVAKSGRGSTNLSATNGTRPYINNFLGGVQ